VRRWALVAALLGALALCANAAAHPLGNFTINRFSRLEVSGDRLYVLYVLDMAEIPTFQARPTIDREGEDAYANALVAQIRTGMHLSVGGRPEPLRPLRHELAFPPGQAGLHTLRLEALYETRPLARSAPARVAYRDANFSDRIGWKEIVVQAQAGAHVDSATVPQNTVSEELRSYPKDLLQSPLSVTRAEARLSTGSAAGPAPRLTSRRVLEQRVGVRAVADSGFASLIARDHLGVGFVLVSLAIALFWGAAHAFSPGHGKSIVAAYLVGSRGTARHAALLGLTVTVTHTIGVFALGLVTLSLSAFVLPEQLFPWLNLASALLVVSVGVTVLRWRLREWRAARAHAHAHAHGDAHDHHHHHHAHDHSHDPTLSKRSLLGVGISGGIIPCPTALVVLLAAISLHRVGYGLLLIVAFSVGLAAAMTGIGLLAVTAKRVFNRVDFNGGLLRLLPAMSAIVVLGLGIAMTVRAVPKVH
jgi:ABC-type nickel/cobalt efflux system permease component RcnA